MKKSEESEEKVEWVVKLSRVEVCVATVTVQAASHEDACEEAEELANGGDEEIDWELQDPYGCDGVEVTDCEEAEV